MQPNNVREEPEPQADRPRATSAYDEPGSQAGPPSSTTEEPEPEADRPRPTIEEPEPEADQPRATTPRTPTYEEPESTP